MKDKIGGLSNVLYNVGDTLVAQERVWSKDKGAYIRKGKEITINHMDELILLPEPHKWIKK